jgi:hypothetical protein
MQADLPSDLSESDWTGFDWQGALAEREAQARDLIRSHPVAAVLSAAALGFVIARLVRGKE